MKLKIAVLPGDGIGPEIMDVALDVVKATAKKFNHELEYKKALVGACAIDAVGSPYPEETHKLCMESDAVLFGAIGSPKYDNDPTAKVRPEQGLLAMRKQLGLYANIRPVTTFPSLIYKSPLRADLVEGADFMCIRELTGGLYFGRPQGRSEDGQTAYDTCVYSRYEIERIVRLAYASCALPTSMPRNAARRWLLSTKQTSSLPHVCGAKLPKRLQPNFLTLKRSSSMLTTLQCA